MADFQIENTQNTLYLDKGGQPVNGYRIRVRLLQWDELHDINVPSLDPPIVAAAVQKLIEQRTALDNLGSG